MNKYVIDTQAIIKFLNGQKVINENIDQILKMTDEGKNIIIIPFSIVDVVKIINSSVNYVEEKLSINIIKSAFEIKDIPELHDKLIAGTARYLNLPLITNDPVILKSSFAECLK